MNSLKDEDFKQIKEIFNNDFEQNNEEIISYISFEDQFNYYTKEEQFIKNICLYIDNDIKYFMKQCLTFRRLQFAHVLKF